MIFPKNTVLFYTFTSLLWLSDFFSGILEILLLSLALAVLSIWLYLLNLINLSLNINWTHLTLKRVWLFILLQLDYFLFGFIIHWLSLLLYISHGFFQFYFIFNLDFLDVLISPWLNWYTLSFIPCWDYSIMQTQMHKVVCLEYLQTCCNHSLISTYHLR